MQPLEELDTINDKIELKLGSNMANSYFEFKTTDPLNIDAYLLAKSTGDKFNFISINLIVCGNEIISTNDVEQTNFVL